MKSHTSIVTMCRMLLPIVLLQEIVIGIPFDRRINLNLTGDCPRIVTRAEWNARKRRDRESLQFTPTPYVVVHHGGIAKYCYDQETCSKIVRSYQNLHMDDRGWFDIGYNFLIGEDGNVYEGRGWDSVGAHAPGYNTQSIGICILGDFTNFVPKEAALKALNSLIECGVSLGKISKEYNALGHRQARNTECPGETFYRKHVIRMPRWTQNPVPIYQNSTTIITTTKSSIAIRNDTGGGVR